MRYGEWNKTFNEPEYDDKVPLRQTKGHIITGYAESVSEEMDFTVIKTNSKGDEEWSLVPEMGKHNIWTSLLQIRDSGYLILRGSTFDVWRITLRPERR